MTRRGRGRQSRPIPKTLYHTTSARKFQSIQRRGLDPKVAGSTHGLERRWIYLAIDKGQSQAYDAFFPDEDVVLLAIDVGALDEARFGPDDQDLPDMLAQIGDEREWQDVDWLESLYLSGQATYDGLIPPNAIHVVERWHAGSFD